MTSQLTSYIPGLAAFCTCCSLIVPLQSPASFQRGTKGLVSSLICHAYIASVHSECAGSFTFLYILCICHHSFVFCTVCLSVSLVLSWSPNTAYILGLPWYLELLPPSDLMYILLHDVDFSLCCCIRVWLGLQANQFLQAIATSLYCFLLAAEVSFKQKRSQGHAIEAIDICI